MIELISEARCIRCDICVRICPTNVFESRPDQAPVLARQGDCQTCYMCELYCPANALFVAPEADENVSLSEQQLSQTGLLGSYRDAVGWGEKPSLGARGDQSFRILSLPVITKKPAEPLTP